MSSEAAVPDSWDDDDDLGGGLERLRLASMTPSQRAAAMRGAVTVGGASGGSGGGSKKAGAADDNKGNSDTITLHTMVTRHVTDSKVCWCAFCLSCAHTHTHTHTVNIGDLTDAELRESIDPALLSALDNPRDRGSVLKFEEALVEFMNSYR